MFLIGCNSLKLAVDTYFIELPNTDIRKVFANGIDIFFNIAFLLEAIIKCIALGFL